MNKFNCFFALLLPIITLGQDSIAKPDKPFKNNFYLSLEIGYNFYTSGLYQTKYADGSWAHIKGADFNYKFPSIGFGHIFSNHNLFVRNELSFWYGLKKVTYNDQASPDDSYRSNPGSRVTINYDYFNGYVDYLNLDWDFALGIGRRSKFGMLIGFKRNFIPYYSVDGEFQRNVVSYITYWTYAPPSNYTEHLEVYHGNEIKKVWGQKVYGTTYVNLGLSFKFKIKEKVYFSELALSVPHDLFYNEFEMHYINFKIIRYIGQKKNG